MNTLRFCAYGLLIVASSAATAVEFGPSPAPQGQTAANPQAAVNGGANASANTQAPIAPTAPLAPTAPAAQGISPTNPAPAASLAPASPQTNVNTTQGIRIPAPLTGADQQPNINASGSASLTPPAASTRASGFNQLDRDADSQLSAAEVGLDASSPQFKQRDANHDGSLSELEFNAPLN